MLYTLRKLGKLKALLFRLKKLQAFKEAQSTSPEVKASNVPDMQRESKR